MADSSAKMIVLTVFLIYAGCVQAAHLPPEDEVQTYFDMEVEDGEGHSDNNPAEMFQDLLINSKLNSGDLDSETVYSTISNPVKVNDSSTDSEKLVDGSILDTRKRAETTLQEQAMKLQEQVMMQEQAMIQEQMKQQELKLEQMKQEVKQRQILQERMRLEKQQELQVSEEALQQGLQQRLSKQELISLFFTGVRASVTMFPGCSLTHFILRARCSANVVEVTVSSRVPAKGHLSLVGGRGQVILDGAYQVMYAVMTREWKLTKELLKGDLDPNCPSCHHLKAQLVLQLGEYTCGAEVDCKRSDADLNLDAHHTPSPPNVPPHYVPSQHIPSFPPNHVPSPHLVQPSNQIPFHPPSPSYAHVPSSPSPSNPLELGSAIRAQQDPTLSATTSLAVYHGPDGSEGEVVGPVTLGAKLTLVVSVSNPDLALDLHVVKCEIRDEGSRSVTLVKDGCSASQVMGEFKEVVTSEGEESNRPSSVRVRRVSQRATLQIFNTRASPQNITILCVVKMCSVECSERPSCVQSDINLGKSKRPSWALFSRQVTLSTTIPVLGFLHKPIATDTSKIFAVGGGDVINPSYVDCVSYRTVYVLLSMLTALYLSLLVGAMICSHRCMAKVAAKRKFIDEDTESPTRPLYTEYSSPRKRATQKSSPEHSVFSMNTDCYAGSQRY